MFCLGYTGRPSRLASAMGVVFCLVVLAMVAQGLPDIYYHTTLFSPSGLFVSTALGAFILGFTGLLYYMATSYLVASHSSRDGNPSLRICPIPSGNNWYRLQGEHSGLIASFALLIPALLITSVSWGMLELLTDPSLEFSERIFLGCIWILVSVLGLLLWWLAVRYTMSCINGLSIRLIMPVASAAPGEFVPIHIESRRKIAADAISLWLVCEERAVLTTRQYHGGASFPREEVLKRPLEEATPLSNNNGELYRGTVVIPADAMHSLELQHNGVLWLLQMDLHRGKRTIYRNRYYLVIAAG